MRYAISLLNRARKTWQTDAETARQAGVTRQTLNAIRRGKAMSPELASLIAASIGESATDAATAVMLENASPDRKRRLAEAAGD